MPFLENVSPCYWVKHFLATYKLTNSDINYFVLVLFCCLAVDDGSIIDVNFCDFVYHAPEGFQKIMFEKSLL